MKNYVLIYNLEIWCAARSRSFPQRAAPLRAARPDDGVEGLALDLSFPPKLRERGCARCSSLLRPNFFAGLMRVLNGASGNNVYISPPPPAWPAPWPGPRFAVSAAGPRGLAGLAKGLTVPARSTPLCLALPFRGAWPALIPRSLLVPRARHASAFCDRRHAPLPLLLLAVLKSNA